MKIKSILFVITLSFLICSFRAEDKFYETIDIWSSALSVYAQSKKDNTKTKNELSAIRKTANEAFWKIQAMASNGELTNYPDAVEKMNMINDIERQAGEPFAWNYFVIGQIYYYKKDYENALNAHEKSIGLSNEARTAPLLLLARTRCAYILLTAIKDCDYSMWKFKRKYPNITGVYNEMKLLSDKKTVVFTDKTITEDIPTLLNIVSYDEKNNKYIQYIKLLKIKGVKIEDVGVRKRDTYVRLSIEREYAANKSVKSTGEYVLHDRKILTIKPIENKYDLDDYEYYFKNNSKPRWPEEQFRAFELGEVSKDKCLY